VAKLIILSIVIVSFLFPLPLATAANPRRALRRTQIAFFFFVIVWAYLCARWYPTLVELK
jgi:hypothetical protein